MKAPPAVLVGRLLSWYRAGHRDLPWRRTRDPYRVWVSEVMLQQTRVEAVLGHYERFLGRFPTLASLAEAGEEEVLASWAGLGYYRRARMLHAAAKRIVGERGGEFPQEFRDLQGLPGIGGYTAGAIASIVFDKPRAALDGNAFRVLARLSDERREIRVGAAQRALRALAASLMETVPPGSRGDFTQSLIELGATVCVPRVPKCHACPWCDACAGFAAGTAPDLPAKVRRAAPDRVKLSVALVVRSGRVLLRQRARDASIMPGFWQLPAAEGGPSELRDVGPLGSVDPETVGRFSHAITDTLYTVDVYVAEAHQSLSRQYRWVPLAELGELPLSTISRKALDLIPGYGAIRLPE